MEEKSGTNPNEKNDALQSMLAQYETNNTPKYEKSGSKTYDLKNYFNTFIEKDIKSGTKTVRVLPVEGGSPFVEMRAHKVQVDGEWKTFACLDDLNGSPCPLCEARQALLASNEESDKELAKKFNSRLMYVVKVIDRDNEADGVKFWRIPHDYRKEGIYDKIHGVISALRKDITSPTEGRDLVLTINRNQNNFPVVSSVVALDASPLSTDEIKSSEWLGDTRTWEDVYSIRTYDYLEIIVKGGIPVWDKENKGFIDKAAVSKTEENDKLDKELSIGVDNVKENVVEATPSETTATTEKTDDLPF